MAQLAHQAAPAAHKCIPLTSVRDALLFARVRRAVPVAQDGRPLARCAAYTQNPCLTPMACREARRWPAGVRPRRVEIVGHFGPMHAGDLVELLQRVRREHGLAEVRRTWGAGMRALQANFAQGVMR